MIKYYCDICKKEITENKRNAKLTCSILPTPARTCDMVFHEECVREFVGKDRIAQMQAEADERKKLAEERRKARTEKQ